MTWTGTCQRERTMPRTMPVGKRMPQANVCTRMWIHSVVSWVEVSLCIYSSRVFGVYTIGSGETPSPSGMLSSWCSWACTLDTSSPPKAAATIIWCHVRNDEAILLYWLEDDDRVNAIIFLDQDALISVIHGGVPKTAFQNDC